MTEERPAVPVGVERSPGIARAADFSRSGSPERVIPQATVTRLATYLRVLGILADDGVLIVSSEELANAAGVGSAGRREKAGPATAPCRETRAPAAPVSSRQHRLYPRRLARRCETK